MINVKVFFIVEEQKVPIEDDTDGVVSKTIFFFDIVLVLTLFIYNIKLTGYI